MPDHERAAREQRRLRYMSRLGIEGKHSREPREGKGSVITPKSPAAQAAIVQGTGVNESALSPLSQTQGFSERKPWESLVIGDLGENLSYIEEKDREIEQQRFIVKHCEENSPHQVDHHRKLLEQLIQERGDMKDDKENNMPEEEREERDRVSERLGSLNWALDTCQCKDEEVNIRAAIQGYNSGQIPYSWNFTLIYAGHIVDVCPTYRSFCEDRKERLDRYFAQHGPGWLWHEPPLACPNSEALAKKGLGLDREYGPNDTYNIGNYPVDLRFTVDISKVARGKKRAYQEAMNDMNQSPDAEVWCQFKTLLDTGATFPILNRKDLRQLDFDPTRYASQGVMRLMTVNGHVDYKFYEMHVSVCSEDGESLVGEGDQAVWPAEARTLGGFCPVQIDPSEPAGRVHYTNRLSGMIPFEACYMSSAPTMKKIWLGEDRRDVLGANRLPAHLRFESEKILNLDCPAEFEKLREAARTPDQVIFAHNINGDPDALFTDSDLPDYRGKSELAIVQNRVTMGGKGKHPSKVAMARKSVQVEPRNGGFKEVPKRHLRWRDNFINLDDLEFEAKDYDSRDNPDTRNVIPKREA
ncbi:hypothetical protein F5X99DRAFT_419394 [Biscogniauxia marginata]|nr:hypothetical protein F5X99DRAFT_419394 [Biscogniauxia marginata]